MKLTHASVFSGIGGPEVAATMLGWENLFHCEINPFGKAVLDYWYPNAKSYEDITKTDFSEWRGRVNVLTGGFPCQPFSYAGQRRGATDDRYLWPYMFRCIDQIRPDWVVAENVGGILTMVEQGEVSEMAGTADLFGAVDGVRGYKLRETFTLQRICDDLESHGYSVQPILIPACAVGAPHRRDRVFIVGCRAASDTDKRTDLRESGKSGGTDGRARMEERNEIRESDKSDNVRPESERHAAADAESIGQLDGDRQGRRAISGRSHLEKTERSIDEVVSDGKSGIVADASGFRRSSDDRDDRRERQSGTCWQHIPQGDTKGKLRTGIGQAGDIRNTTDTNSNRGCKMDEHMESQQPDGAEPVSNGREWDVTDTNGEFREAKLQQFGKYKSTSEIEFTRIYSRRGSETEICGERWANFPTISPVHRGNDGIPFPLDCLTLSAGKWRTEALKAYGNAIVPQVMYEIFRAIALTYEH